MKNVTIIIIVVLSIISVLSLGVAMLFGIELHASNTLLNSWATVQLGSNISYVKSNLGKPMREMTTMEDIAGFASIKDPNFLQNKKLFWFYVSTPPCRVLEVYTDVNDVVVYSTWQGL
jgi:hypothetical protein